MPLVRVQVRNEYGLGLPQLYREANREDPKSVLDGVAVAGLVGILRQLGDLAEFAAEVFHGLQEQVMSTASRSHKIMVRVEKIEVSLPQIEKAALTQTSHIHLAYASGSDWHPRIRNTHNHFIYNDLPRFIMDNYEECREPPHLFLLDRFDIGGNGSCLKRYTDPTFFKKVSSGYIEDQVRSDKKACKRKKRRFRQRNGEISGMSIRNAGSRMHFDSPNIKGKTSQIAVTFDMTLKSELGNKSKCSDSKKGTVFTDSVSHASSILPTEEEESIELPSSMLKMQSDLGNKSGCFDSKKGPSLADCVSISSPSLLPEEANFSELPSSRLKMQLELGNESRCFDSKNGPVIEDYVSHSNSTLPPEVKESIVLPSSGLTIQHCVNPVHPEEKETSDLPFSSIKMHHRDGPTSDFLDELHPIADTYISTQGHGISNSSFVRGHEKTEIFEPNSQLHNSENYEDVLSIDYYLGEEEGSFVENAIILDNFYDAEYVKMDIVDYQVQPHDACMSPEKLESSDSVPKARYLNSTLIRVDIPNDGEYLKKNVSGDDQFEEVESETDDYMDALNTLDSESESDPDCHRNRDVKHFSPDFSDCEEQLSEHHTSDFESPIICSSPNHEMPVLLLKSAHEDSLEFVETLVPNISSVSCGNDDSPVFVKYENSNSNPSSPRSTGNFLLSPDGDKPLNELLDIDVCENNPGHFDHLKFGTISLCSSFANCISVFPILQKMLRSSLDVDICDSSPGYPDQSKFENSGSSLSFPFSEIFISPHPTVEMVLIGSPGVDIYENDDALNNSSFELACSDPSSSSSTISSSVPSYENISSSSLVNIFENFVISGYLSFDSVCGDPSICSSVPWDENIPSSSPVDISENTCISGYSNIKSVSSDPSSLSCTICSSVPCDENISSNSSLVNLSEDDGICGYSTIELLYGDPSSSSSTIFSSVPSDENILSSSPAVNISEDVGISGFSDFELICCNLSSSSSTICCSVQSHENISSSSPFVDISENTGTSGSLNINSVFVDLSSSNSAICNSALPSFENISSRSPVNISVDAGISGYSNFESVCGNLSSSNSIILCSVPSDENISCGSPVVDISENACFSGYSNLELVCGIHSSPSSTICSSMQSHDNIPSSSPVDISENTDIPGYSNIKLTFGNPLYSSSSVCTSVRSDENMSSSSLVNLSEGDGIFGYSDIELACGNPPSSSSRICCSVQSDENIPSSSPLDISENYGISDYSNCKSVCSDPSSPIFCSMPHDENIRSYSPVDISENFGICDHLNFKSVCADPSSSNSTICSTVPSDEIISRNSSAVNILESAGISDFSNFDLVCGNLSSSISTIIYSVPSDENISSSSLVDNLKNSGISDSLSIKSICGDPSSSSSTICSTVLSDKIISSSPAVNISESSGISDYSNFEMVCCGNPSSSISTIFRSVPSDENISSNSPSVDISEINRISGYSNFKLVCGDDSSSSASSTICNSLPSKENISNCSPVVNISDNAGIFGHSNFDSVGNNASLSCSTICTSVPCGENILSTSLVDIHESTVISVDSDSQSAYSGSLSSPTCSDIELVVGDSSPSTICAFKCENSDDILITSACKSQKPVENFAAVESIKIWTNGGLLGLEPSKPPDFGAMNATSEESVEKILDSTILSSGCNEKHERNGDLTMTEAEPEPPVALDVKTMSGIEENDGNLFNVFGLKINTNGFRRTKSPVFDKSEPSNVDTILKDNDGHGVLGDLPSSPPLEPMQITFNTVDNAFEKSKLKLKFLDQSECHESIADVFHSFQLISKPINIPHDIVFDSNDDTFYGSSPPYHASDVYSKSDYELWESCEQMDGEQTSLFGNEILPFVQEFENDVLESQNGIEYAPLPPLLPPLQWWGMNSHSDECKNSDVKIMESNICNHAEPAIVREDITEVEFQKMLNGKHDAVEATKKVGINERKDFLEQIKLKSFNLRRGATERARFLTTGPTTPGKVTAILEKANSIRQAVGSDDGEEDEEDKWSDT